MKPTSIIWLIGFSLAAVDGFSQSYWENDTLKPQTYTSGTVSIGIAPGPVNAKLRILANTSASPIGVLIHNTSVITAPDSRYGLYSFLDNSAPSVPNYAIYAESPVAANSYAGYFQGNGYFSGNLGIGTGGIAYNQTEKLEVRDGSIVLSGNYNRFVLHHQWWNGTSNSFMIAPYDFINSQWDWANGLQLHKTGRLEVRNAIIKDTLKVHQKLWAKAIEIKLPPFPDYVFEPGYTLMPLDSLAAFIDSAGHLPGVDAAHVIDGSEGTDVATLLVKQMEKIEELSLYILYLNDELKKLRQELEKIKP